MKTNAHEKEAARTIMYTAESLSNVKLVRFTNCSYADSFDIQVQRHMYVMVLICLILQNKTDKRVKKSSIIPLTVL